MEKEKLAWRSFVDVGNAGAGPLARTWNVSATPTLYLIDARGVTGQMIAVDSGQHLS